MLMPMFETTRQFVLHTWFSNFRAICWENPPTPSEPDCHPESSSCSGHLAVFRRTLTTHTPSVHPTSERCSLVWTTLGIEQLV